MYSAISLQCNTEGNQCEYGQALPHEPNSRKNSSKPRSSQLSSTVVNLGRLLLFLAGVFGAGLPQYALAQYSPDSLEIRILGTAGGGEHRVARALVDEITDQYGIETLVSYVSDNESAAIGAITSLSGDESRPELLLFASANPQYTLNLLAVGRPLALVARRDLAVYVDTSSNALQLSDISSLRSDYDGPVKVGANYSAARWGARGAFHNRGIPIEILGQRDLSHLQSRTIDALVSPVSSIDSPDARQLSVFSSSLSREYSLLASVHYVIVGSQSMPQDVATDLVSLIETLYDANRLPARLQQENILADFRHGGEYVSEVSNAIHFLCGDCDCADHTCKADCGDECPC